MIEVTAMEIIDARELLKRDRTRPSPQHVAVLRGGVQVATLEFHREAGVWEHTATRPMPKILG